MAESIASLNIAIRASADKIASDVTRDINAAQGAIQTRAVALGAVIASGITAGLSAAVGGIKAAISSAFDGLDRIDAMDEMASKIGVAYNSMVDLSYAATTTGGSVESLSSSIIKMQQNITNGKADGAFGQLRMDVEKIKALKPEDQFTTIAERISKIGNQGDKLDITKQIFGKGGTELMNMINLGKQGFADISKEIEGMGGHLSAVQVAMASMANDQLDKVSAQFGFLKDQIAVGLAPAILSVIKYMQAFVLTFNQDGGGIAGKIQEWADKAIDFAADLARGAQWVTTLYSIIKAGAVTVKEAIGSIGAAFAGIATVGIQALKVLWADIKVEIIEAKNGFKQFGYEVEVAFVKVSNSIRKALRGAIDMIPGLKDTLGSAVDVVNKPVKSAASGINSFIKGSMPQAPKGMAGPLENFDLPSGVTAGGLFPDILLPAPPVYDLPDYTQLGKEIDLLKVTATDSFRVVNDAGNAAFDNIAKAGSDAVASINDLAVGERWDDQFRESVDGIKKAAAEISTVTRNHRATEEVESAAAMAADKARRDAIIKEKLNEFATLEKAQKESQERVAKANEQTMERFRQISQDSITGMVTSWATGTGKISDIVSRWANQMIEQFIQVSLWGNKAGGGSMGGLLGQFSGGAAKTGGSTGGSVVGSIIGSLFGFAEGGRPPMGRVSVVGERGPELFVPDSAGRIIPNHRMGTAMSAAGGSAGGGHMEMASPIIINQTFTNGVTRAELAGSMDEMMDQTKSAVASAISRGGGYRKRIQS